MKIFKSLFLVSLVILVSCAGSRRPVLQRVTDAGLLQQMLENKNFIFVAENVQPMRGSLRNLSSSYDLTLRNDSLISELPYFGQARRAPMNPSDISLRFTSKDFAYDLVQNKPGQWDINIKPEDFSGVRQLFLEVYDNGRARLNVNSLSRDPISFMGFITRNPDSRNQ